MATTVVHQGPPNTVIMPAAQTVQYHNSTGPLPSENLNVDRAKATGWIQIVCAALSVILGGVAYGIEACKYQSATPIWCGGLFYLPAGILGVISGYQKSSCTIIGCMVMSILSSIVSVSHFGVNLSGALNEGDYCFCHYNDFLCYDDYSYITYYYYDDQGGKIAVNSILTVIAVIEFITAIVASSAMCGGTNCCRRSSTTQVTVVSNQVPTTTTAHVIQTGYPGYTQQPPVMPYGQQPAYPYQPPPGANYPPPSYAAEPAGKM